MTWREQLFILAQSFRGVHPSWQEGQGRAVYDYDVMARNHRKGDLGRDQGMIWPPRMCP